MGHITTIKFPDPIRDWSTTPVEQLFKQPLEIYPLETAKFIVQNLKFYSQDISTLIIWTDCDREGEAIGQDIVEICSGKMHTEYGKDLDVLRAKYSNLS